MSKRYLTERQVSEMTGRAVQTLRNDRYRGIGFPYLKTGKSVRYDEDAIIAVMKKYEIQTTSFK